MNHKAVEKTLRAMTIGYTTTVGYGLGATCVTRHAEDSWELDTLNGPFRHNALSAAVIIVARNDRNR